MRRLTADNRIPVGCSLVSYTRCCLYFRNKTAKLERKPYTLISVFFLSPPVQQATGRSTHGMFSKPPCGARFFRKTLCSPVTNLFRTDWLSITSMNAETGWPGILPERLWSVTAWLTLPELYRTVKQPCSPLMFSDPTGVRGWEMNSCD